MLQNIRSILISKSLKQVGLYTFTASFCKAISFAALPFFVNQLSEGDIGILNIFSNCIVFLTPIISLGVLYSISIDYFKLSKADYARVFSTSMAIPAVFSLLLIPVLYLLQGPLERAFNFQSNFFWLIPACLFLNFCFEAFVIIARNQNKVQLFAVVSVSKIIIEVGMSILLIILVYKNWYSRALAFLASGLFIAVVFFFHTSKNKFLIKAIDTNILKKELFFGLSGMVLQTAIFFINLSDKFFVMSFFGKDQAGYYAVAATFATIQFIVCSSLLQYLQPLLFSRFAAGKKWPDVKGLFYKYFLGMIAALIGITIFTIIVYNHVLRPAYKEYLHYFYMLGLSSFVWTISNIFMQFLVFRKDKKSLVQLSLWCIAVAVTINYITARYFNINMLAGSQVIINLAVLGIMLWYNQRAGFFIAGQTEDKQPL